MCAWPLYTAHMHAWACQCRYPPGHTRGERHPPVPPGRRQAACGAELTTKGNGMRQSGMSEAKRPTHHAHP
eukprot:4885376-Prymnesium_polylepis.1